jgi:AcrR family transcriptional regulator
MALERQETARSAKKRALLLDVTEQIMLEDGYAAVSSRSVAARAGMNAPLVHYYFTTLDDLFVGVLRRGAGRNLERFASALASPEPLRSLWEMSIDPRGTAIVLEMAAAANHRKAIKVELIQISDQLRRIQIEAFTQLLETYGIDSEDFPPELVAITLAGITRLIVNEQTLGITAGHRDALAALDRFLRQLEHRRHRRRRRRTSEQASP